MSEDPDFEMEVVEDDELDELGADGAWSSEKRVLSDAGNTEKSDGSESEVQDHDSGIAQHRTTPSDSSNKEDGGAQRFGPFTMGVPEEWRAERQGKVKQLFTRGKQPTYAEDGVPVINQECIYWNDWHFENLRFLDREEAKEWPEKYFPKKGDIILNSTGQGTLGRAQVYPDEERRAVDSHVTILRTTDDLNPHFHRYFLESHLGQALLYSMCVNGSTGQIELSKTRLDLMPVPIPPLPEQRKIASVLYAVDQAIQKTEEIIERTQRVQRGLLQELLTTGYWKHETEHAGALGKTPADWRKAKLHEVAEVQRGKFTHRPRNDPGFYGGDYPFIQTGEVVEATGELSDYSQTLNEKGKGVSKRFEPGTIILTIAGNIGDTAVATFPVYFPDSLVGITPSDEVDPYFLEFYLRKRKPYLNRLATETTQKNLNLSLLRPVDVAIPPLEEQKKIAGVLKRLDSKVRTERGYVSCLHELKKGLMQDLLTGEVRTADKAIEVLEEVRAHG